MKKYVWSDKYGRNPSEGIHNYLEKNIIGYRRNNLNIYIKGFAKFIDPNSNKSDSVNLISNNFSHFKKFIKQKKTI